MTVRVLIVDDQSLVRRGLRTILGAFDDLEIVGEAADGAEAIALVARRSPDVVLMDLRMPGMDGLTATRALARAGTSASVLVLTTFDEDELVFAALEAGAAGFLLKDAEPEELVAAIRLLAAGDGLIDPTVVRRLIVEFTRTRPPAASEVRTAALTPREHEVLLLLAEGLSNADIGRRLVLEETTVKGHVARLLGKLRLRSRAQAVVWAYETGLVRPGRPIRPAGPAAAGTAPAVAGDRPAGAARAARHR